MNKSMNKTSSCPQSALPIGCRDPNPRRKYGDAELRSPVCKVHLVALNSPGLGGIHAFVELYWASNTRATLWYHSEPTTQPNSASVSGDAIRYYGRFSAAQFADSIDLLRNEKPVYFAGMTRPRACDSLLGTNRSARRPTSGIDQPVPHGCWTCTWKSPSPFVRELRHRTDVDALRTGVSDRRRQA